MPATKNAPAPTSPALEALMAQRKQLDEQIKLARQAAKHPPIYLVRMLVPRLRKRISAGTDQDTALDAELADLRVALVNALAAPAER